ncbi:hypothetical protein GW17_00003715 [Ensete ventricosum]|nr:hypothetical protein GW17_00003715 [Ensete ventricosum]
MSSLVERLRVRSEKRPLYNLDDSDDDDFVVGKGSKSKQEEKPAERIERDDAVSPLTEIEKILDCEMRPTVVDANDSSKSMVSVLDLTGQDQRINNLDELFMLMHFLDAGKFASIEDFQKEFKDINQEEQVDRLHKMLAPHLLRTSVWIKVYIFFSWQVDSGTVYEYYCTMPVGTKEELDDIIRYGSKELFVDESDEAKSRQIHYDDAAIDRQDFDKVANFEYIDEVEAAAAEQEESKKQLRNEKASNSNTDRANYWDELLKDRYEVHQIEEFTSMGKGKRSRKQMASAEEDIAGLRDVTSEDEDYSYEDELTDTEASIPGSVSGRRGQFSKRKTRGYLEPIPLMEGEGKSFRVLGFNQNQRSLFQQLVMR